MKVEVRKKGRPRAENQELRSIPASMVALWKEEFKICSRVKCPNSGCWLEFPSIYGLKYHYQRCQGSTKLDKLNHQCPYCEAVFASKTRLEKHKSWNHEERVCKEAKSEMKAHQTSVKESAKKRVAEKDLSPVKNKLKKSCEVLEHSQNGEYISQNSGAKQMSSQTSDFSKKSPRSADVESGGWPTQFPEEDPERTKHRRKQKTPKKFTGEQPSISGTFGLKGLPKSEDKKTGRGKQPGGITCREEPRKKSANSSFKKESVVYSPGSQEEQWQHIISEKGEILCPTCSLVTRKTVPGLKKHMEICQKLQDALKCEHCSKQFKSKAGLNYHTMAEHINKPIVSGDSVYDEQEERERLRKVLKQMGKLKCPSEVCTATFSSLMGYQYHQKRCGKEPSAVEKPFFVCKQCKKSYKSKAGHDYHIRSEHPVKNPQPKKKPVEKEEQETEEFGRTPSGRVRRKSAQVAVFHLQEIAEDELTKDWSKRRMKDDLVPDTKRLNYTRPELPKFNSKILENWKNEVREKGFICCPNNRCEAVYSSVSGLKAHLANCIKGGGSLGKYRCLLCQKDFSSESGVKYHIGKTHSENWFRAANRVSHRSKQKEQDGLKNAVAKSTTGKKRGRKHKERPYELTHPIAEKTSSKTGTGSESNCVILEAGNHRIREDKRKDVKFTAKKRGRSRKNCLE
ncbi:Z512B protein, partial [Polypterus senegalus]|nr:Z512B protein [Polypterus senegalus]